MTCGWKIDPGIRSGENGESKSKAEAQLIIHPNNRRLLNRGIENLDKNWAGYCWRSWCCVQYWIKLWLAGEDELGSGLGEFISGGSTAVTAPGSRPNFSLRQPGSLDPQAPPTWQQFCPWPLSQGRIAVAIHHNRLQPRTANLVTSLAITTSIATLNTTHPGSWGIDNQEQLPF